VIEENSLFQNAAKLIVEGAIFFRLLFAQLLEFLKNSLHDLLLDRRNDLILLQNLS